jgi:taurine dioxygenase
VAPPRGQGQTLFADATAAYEALPPTVQSQIAHLQGIHSASKKGVYLDESKFPDGCQAVRQPIVRMHPEAARRSVFLRDIDDLVAFPADSISYTQGPIDGMETGTHGAGAALMRRLLAHCTQPHFVYAHEWLAGDCMIYDNRCTWHCGPGYERARYPLTVRGNAGIMPGGEVAKL